MGEQTIWTSESTDRTVGEIQFELGSSWAEKSSLLLQQVLRLL